MKSTRSSQVRFSAHVSLLFQLVIGLVTSATLFLPLPQYGRAEDLRTILWLEVVSQGIEFLWYLAVVVRWRGIATYTRYIDWVLSTPVMLTSLGMFFLYRRRIDVARIWQSAPYWYAIAFNWLMLGMGLNLELEVVALPAGLGLGGIALIASFTALGVLLEDATDALSVWLHMLTFAVWALYGVAAALPVDTKNIAYNLLDVVSKNCYGLFLFVYILTTP